MSRVVMLLFVLSAGVVTYAQTSAPAPKTPATPAKPAAPKVPASPAKPTPAKPAPTVKPPTAAAKPVVPKVSATPAAAPAPADVALTTDEQKTIYALGLALQRSIQSLELSPDELAIVLRALADGSAGKPALDLDEWGPRIDPLANTLRLRATENRKAASTAFLDKAATEAGAVKTDSGLVYRDIVAGIGPSPKASDTVKVHYRGTLTNGTVFDSSYERSEPVSFALSGVIPCWTEGVQHMRVGGKAQLVCPSGLAYGDDGSPDIPGGSALVFEIDLLEIVAATVAPR